MSTDPETRTTPGLYPEPGRDERDSPRGSLAWVRQESPEQRSSGELRYLHEMNLAEAATVFERVENMSPGRLAGALDESDLVLLQDPTPILLRRKSLRAMLGLERAAFPARLDAFGKERIGELFTLREFELLEHDLLASGADRNHPGTDCTALLATVRQLRSLDGSLLADWIGGCTALGALAEALHAVSAGICHCFVDYYGNVRDDVLPLLTDDAVEVLEIGCGKGVTGELLQRERGCRVTGVELNPEIASQAAERLHRVVQGDILELELDTTFDAAILFDVLEHVVDAERLLRKVASQLRPGGVILLSIPNVGHYSIVRDLIAGRWDYLPMGLLCYSHVRFFTRSTLADWLARCGFDSFEIIPRRTSLPEEMQQLPSSLEVDLESLTTHGFYVVVRLPSK